MPGGGTIRGLRSESDTIRLWFRRVLRGVLILLMLIVVLVIGGGIYARSQVRASLAQLDGTATIAGLAANVTRRS